MASLDRGYRPTFDGMLPWFTGEEARGLCTAAAEAAAAFARGIAPVGKPPDDQHPGLYRDSITVAEAGTGGPKNDRVCVHVVALAPYAAVIEVQAGHHTLGLACESIGGRAATSAGAQSVRRR